MGEDNVSDGALHSTFRVLRVVVQVATTKYHLCQTSAETRCHFVPAADVRSYLDPKNHAPFFL